AAAEPTRAADPADAGDGPGEGAEQASAGQPSAEQASAGPEEAGLDRTAPGQIESEEAGTERPGPEEAGSSRTVATAVQQALAARARVAQSPNGVVDPRRGDARDRLLAVLLDDPVRAVGATVELQSQQEELSRLAEEMRTRRDELGAVVRRLAAAGLAPDQVAKLAGLDRAEVDRMLDPTRRR
ncbi:hypothetical protein ACFQH9_23635, partial [Pseudonocardia lutea]